MRSFFSNSEKIFTFPLLIALVIGTVIIWLLPPLFKKHDTHIVQHQNVYYNNHIHFSDLDNDGFSEKISLSSVNPDYSYVNFYSSRESLANVWNLKGQINNHSLKVGDYDNDQKKEIYLLTIYKDSLFLNSYHYKNNNQTSGKPVLIATIPKHFDKPDWDVSNPIMKDLNNDGYKELIMSIYGRYSLQPRQIIVYDFKNDSLRKSESIGSILKDIKIISSQTEDAFFITGNTSVTNYISDSMEVKYKDDRAWILVFDEDLELQFKPISANEQGSIIECLPVRKNGRVYFVALFTNHFNHKNSRLLLINQEGEIVNELESKNEEFYGIFRDGSMPDNQFYLTAGSNTVTLLNADFSRLQTLNIPGTGSSSFTIKNVDESEDAEIIQWLPSSKSAIIYKTGFSEQLSLKLPELHSKSLSISVKKTATENQICFKDFNHFYLVSYERSQLYPLKYVVFAVIYIIPFLILYATQKTLALRKMKSERVISQLKLTSIKNQIDPHFTLNALNAIGSSILSDQKKKSYEYLQRFSRLIRHSLTEADNISRSLNDEINFIKDYLDVLQIRYTDKFDYQIEIEDNVELSHQIPKMIIQSFVENAINHGIKPKESKGFLRISLSNYSSGLKAEVTDDGVGRDIAQKQKESKNTGKGIHNINEYINIFNKYNKQKIVYRIIDLYDNRKPAGTKIIIYIPYSYDYRIY